MMGNDTVNMARAAGGATVNEADGFRFLQSGEEVMMADAEARRRLSILEAMPGLWAGTHEEYEKDNQAGLIPDGTVLVFTDEADGTDAQESREE